MKACVEKRAATAVVERKTRRAGVSRYIGFEFSHWPLVLDPEQRGQAFGGREWEARRRDVRDNRGVLLLAVLPAFVLDQRNPLHPRPPPTQQEDFSPRHTQTDKTSNQADTSGGTVGRGPNIMNFARPYEE